MRPFEALSKNDLSKIENYIILYSELSGKGEYCGNATWLRAWDKNKEDLFRLFGNKLIISFPFNYEVDRAELKNEMYASFIEAEKVKNFIREVNGVIFERNNGNYCHNLWDLVGSADLLIDNATKYDLTFKNAEAANPLKINRGIRIFKAIDKVLAYYGIKDQYKAKMEELRILHSQILNTKTISGTACLSIHPLDFMTMSDNANDWSSCMSWKREGCYRQGTVEMMNSKYVIVAYLKANKDFKFGEGAADIWNSKKIRQLIYFDEAFIIAGKTYPYVNYAFTDLCLDKLAEMAAAANLTYDVKDTYSWYDDAFKITMDAMYNDLLNDTDTIHKGYFNRSKLNELPQMVNISGPVYCLHSGEPNVLKWNDSGYGYPDFEEDDRGDIEEYFNSRYYDTSQLVSESFLKTKRCDRCGEPSSILYELDGQRLCPHCWESEVKIDPISGRPFYTDYYGAIWEGAYPYQLLEADSATSLKLGGNTCEILVGGKRVYAVPLFMSDETRDSLKFKEIEIEVDSEYYTPSDFPTRILIPDQELNNAADFYYQNLKKAPFPQI